MYSYKYGLFLETLKDSQYSSFWNYTYYIHYINNEIYIILEYKYISMKYFRILSSFYNIFFYIISFTLHLHLCI